MDWRGQVTGNVDSTDPQSLQGVEPWLLERALSLITRSRLALCL